MDIRQARHDPALWSALWPTTPEQARTVQDRLRGAVETADRFGPLHRIAALDAHYGAEGTVTWAAAALLAVPGLELMRSALVAQPTRFPYVPGLLSFREAPAMIDALEMLGPDPDLLPDLLLVDGHGIAHPRRLGIAAHVGALTDLPTIGVAKSLLTGRFIEPGPSKGEWSPLISRGQVIGAALRTRDRVSPVFVSTGHRVSLETAIRLVLDFTGKLRLPEPIRIADALSRMHN